MSGNSACRRRQTVPIVSSCRWSCLAVACTLTPLAAALCGLAHTPRTGSWQGLAGRVACSFLQEGQLVLADLQLVAVLELSRLDPLPVQEGAVEASLVFDEEVAVPPHQHGVLSGDRDVVQEDVAVRGAADRRPLALRHELLAGTPAPRPDDQGRPFG